jgi:hypothetical protein
MQGDQPINHSIYQPSFTINHPSPSALSASPSHCMQDEITDPSINHLSPSALSAALLRFIQYTQTNQSIS